MNRKPQSPPAAIPLAALIVAALGCQQEQGSPPPGSAPTATTAAQSAAAEEPEIPPPPDDAYKADRIAVTRCCAALQNKLRTTEGPKKGKYAMAMGVCNAERRTRKGKEDALEKIRKALGEVKPPGACR